MECHDRDVVGVGSREIEVGHADLDGAFVWWELTRHARQSLRKARHGTLGDGPDEVVLAVEVIVERRWCETQPSGDLAERDVDSTRLGEDLASGLQDLFPGLQALPFAMAQAMLRQDGQVVLRKKRQARLARGLMGRSAPASMLISHRALLWVETVNS